MRISTLPTRAEMSWLFSSPGSVLAMAIWLRIDGYSLTTRNWLMSPPNSVRRLAAHGDMIELR
ncbi:hypothetical protein D3C72_1943080 [compost metagenome]